MPYFPSDTAEIAQNLPSASEQNFPSAAEQNLPSAAEQNLPSAAAQNLLSAVFVTDGFKVKCYQLMQLLSKLLTFPTPACCLAILSSCCSSFFSFSSLSMVNLDCW